LERGFGMVHEEQTLAVISRGCTPPKISWLTKTWYFCVKRQIIGFFLKTLYLKNF
jgi:hypothetical protein